MNIQKFLKKNKQICCIIAIIILYFLFKNINIERFLVGGQGVEATCGDGPHVINGKESRGNYPCTDLDSSKVFNNSHKDTVCGDSECSNKDIDICCYTIYREIMRPDVDCTRIKIRDGPGKDTNDGHFDYSQCSDTSFRYCNREKCANWEEEYERR